MSAVDEAAAELDQRLGDLPTLTFPEGYTYTGSWKRARSAPSDVSPSENPAEFHVLLGRGQYHGPNSLNYRQGMSHHRVTFAILDGELVAECPCNGWAYRGVCSHVLHLWWRWVRDRLAVTDLDTRRKHLSPPWWLEVSEP